MTRSASVIIFLLWPILLPAQSPFGSIKGVITDKSTYELMPFATVELTRNDTVISAVTTDLEGEYLFARVIPGRYSIKCAYLGYQTRIMKNISVAPGQTVDVSLALAPTSKQIDLVECVVYTVPMIDASIKNGCTVTRENVRSVVKGKRRLDGAIIRGSRSQPEHNTENYDRIYDNGFKRAKENPLSTFSVDVDRASYANARRYIMEGSLPPADAVRTEEMINYFSYDYPQPKGNDPFSVSTEMAECPWNPAHRLVHVGLQGKNIQLENAPPSNLVFLIDVSGSMESPDKLPLLKSAFSLLADQLTGKDRVSIVVYAGAAGLVLPPTPGDKKDIIKQAIELLEAGGSTAGGEGIALAYEIAIKNFMKDGNNRVILATDGDFNVGVSSDAELVRMIESKRDEGVFLTVLGFGMGNYKDSKMEKLADKGNGNYSYIDNILEAKKMLVKEMGGTLHTIAKDVKIQVEFNPAVVSSYRLIGYENRLLNDEDFNDDKEDAGEMGAGHSVTVLYEIIPAGKEKENTAGIDPLKYQSITTNPAAGQSGEIMTVKFRYKQPNDFRSKLHVESVKDSTVKLEAASGNLRFAAAVAGFAMLLRDSEFRGNADYDRIIRMAKESKGADEDGYRAEFIRLVEMCELLDARSAKE